VVKENNLIGRGSSDDKGQMFTHLKALESFLATTGRLPVNVKCLFEGEEEIGSPHFTAFIERNRDALKADVAVVSDTSMLGPDRPSIIYSTRGQLGLELEVRGPGHDLHSGSFGGAVHDPLQALCEMLAQLHDRDRRIAIPGFYDRVRRWDQHERDFMRREGPQDKGILRNAEAESGWGERGYTLYERLSIRPCLTINGLSGGYQGTGGKGVIPARAVAKLSFRLVPDQEPREIDRLFRRHIATLTPPTVKSTVRTHMSAKSAYANRRHPAMRAAAEAYRRAFKRLPAFQRSGGSLPVVSIFQQILGIPTILMGFGLPDDRTHAPNEKFHLPNFYRGIETSIWFLSIIGATRQSDAGQNAVAASNASVLPSTHIVGSREAMAIEG
jgi:acetylornithine deacetylase/succinyl-diaminopimelate desuccinylase-like protein